MPAAHPFSFDEANSRFRSAIEYVNSRIINRVEVIDQAFCALLMREHVLMQSRTGAAKSLLSQQIFRMFEGANLFMVQASKEQQPDTYFGALDVEELKKGHIVHNTKGSLVESEFGFIDEIFDANDYTLRALLTTLNERALILGAQVVPARVHTVIAATNYLRVSEITEALLDRFIFKSLFIPTKNGYVQYQIARRYLTNHGRATTPDNPIPYALLDRTSRIVKGEDDEISISIPLSIIFFANAVVRYYESQRNRLLKENPQANAALKDFYISPRTYTRSIDMLRASAFLHGRTEVTVDDVARLWYLHTVVGIKEQKELFQRCFETIRNQYTAAKAFDQIQRMLEFQEYLEVLQLDPSLLGRPITSIDVPLGKRSFLQWAKEVFGIVDGGLEQNRRLLEGYLKTFEPLTEEIHELKQQQERDVHELFNPAAHIWT